MMIACGLGSSALARTALAQSEAWPSRPIRVVVPYPPGGSKKINEGIPDSKVIVENISGGATVPGALSVLNDKADGHTLFMASDNTLNINHWLLKNPRYDGDKDFTPVTVLNAYPHWVIVNPEGKHKNFESLVQYIRDNPGAASLSVNTVGGAAYLALDNWRRVNNLDFVIIPYRGSPPAVIDLIGGQTDAHIDVVGSSVSQARNGKVLPVAVLQSAPLAEFPGAVVQSYDDPKALTVRSNLSVVVRSGTPELIIDRLYDILRKGSQEQDFVQALDTLSYSTVMMEPAKAREFLHAETRRYGELVKQSGLEKQ
jgi:tripartite-type tricarboxylate transporter receptor subunit TctC